MVSDHQIHYAIASPAPSEDFYSSLLTQGKARLPNCANNDQLVNTLTTSPLSSPGKTSISDSSILSHWAQTGHQKLSLDGTPGSNACQLGYAQKTTLAWSSSTWRAVYGQSVYSWSHACLLSFAFCHIAVSLLLLKLCVQHEMLSCALLAWWVKQSWRAMGLPLPLMTHGTQPWKQISFQLCCLHEGSNLLIDFSASSTQKGRDTLRIWCYWYIQ